jgi:hypothetical protein
MIARQKLLLLSTLPLFALLSSTLTTPSGQSNSQTDINRTAWCFCFACHYGSSTNSSRHTPDWCQAISINATPVVAVNTDCLVLDFLLRKAADTRVFHSNEQWFITLLITSKVVRTRSYLLQELPIRLTCKSHIQHLSGVRRHWFAFA